jgi:hypothetical protein
VRQSQHWTPIKDQNCEPFDTKSGIFVVEVDQHGEDGEALLRQACKRLGELPPTLEQRSGGGGRHQFFRYPEGRRMRTTASVIGKGIDTRADNNSCILTPSLHPSGNRHRWSTPVRTNNCADLPAKWNSKLEKVERPTIAAPMPRLRIMSHIGDRLIDRKVSEIARCGNGQRNTQIYRATYYTSLTKFARTGAARGSW